MVPSIVILCAFLHHSYEVLVHAESLLVLTEFFKGLQGRHWRRKGLSVEVDGERGEERSNYGFNGFLF